MKIHLLKVCWQFESDNATRSQFSELLFTEVNDECVHGRLSLGGRLSTGDLCMFGTDLLLFSFHCEKYEPADAGADVPEEGMRRRTRTSRYLV